VPVNPHKYLRMTYSEVATVEAANSTLSTR